MRNVKYTPDQVFTIRKEMYKLRRLVSLELLTKTQAMSRLKRFMYRVNLNRR